MIKYSKSENLWCVPIPYTTVSKAFSWCTTTLGPQYVDGIRQDIWRAGQGRVFGFSKVIGNISMDDNTSYFAFADEQHATMFMLRWC